MLAYQISFSQHGKFLFRTDWGFEDRPEIAKATARQIVKALGPNTKALVYSKPRCQELLNEAVVEYDAL